MNTKELIKAVKNERGSAFQNCNDCEYGTHNGEVIEKLNRLAELEDKIEQGTLKEEKTCENISEMHPVDGFTCSECGISLEDYCEKEVDEENEDITYREYMLRYCPNCGAKIVY